MIQVDGSARMAAWLEDAWLQRYLERQLDADEEAWFEAYVMDKGELLERIDADVQVRDVLARTVAADTQVSMPSSDLRAANRAPRHAAHLRRWHRVGLAATLLAGVGLGWLVKQPAVSEAPSLIASPTRIIFDTERGEAMAPRIEHADSASPYLLIEVPVPPGSSDITLAMGMNKIDALSASADGFVSFLVRRPIQADATAKLTYRVNGVPQERLLTYRLLHPSI